MDANQKKYAMNRITQILTSKQIKLRAQFTKPSKELTDTEILELVRDGDVQLKRTCKVTDSLRDAFDFRRVKPADTFDQEGFNSAYELLKALADRIRDTIMLGDEATALKMIQEFCGN